MIWCLNLAYECTVYPGSGGWLCFMQCMCVYSITGTVRTDKQTGGGITNNVLRSVNRPLAPSVTLRMVVEITNVCYYVHDKNVKNDLLNIIIIYHLITTTTSPREDNILNKCPFNKVLITINYNFCFDHIIFNDTSIIFFKNKNELTNIVTYTWERLYHVEGCFTIIIYSTRYKYTIIYILKINSYKNHFQPCSVLYWW